MRYKDQIDFLSQAEHGHQMKRTGNLIITVLIKATAEWKTSLLTSGFPSSVGVFSL